MKDNGVRPIVAASAVALIAAAAIFIVVMESRPVGQPGAPVRMSSTDSPAKLPSTDDVPAADGGRLSRNATSKPAPLSAPDPVPYIDGLVYGDIDLREARELMPDNLYWLLGSPTKDEEVLAAREEERKRRNEEYGRVLSGDASEEEVHAYYDYRRRISEDYFEFAEFMHRRYKNNPSDELVGMLELAMKLHAAKLAELPKEEDDAIRRSREHATAREEWQRQKEEFGEQ